MKNVINVRIRALPLVFGALLLFFTGACSILFSQVDWAQERIVEYEGFKLRVSRLPHRIPVPLARSHYTIDYARDNGAWTNAHRWSQDDPWSVDDIEIRVLNSNIGYFFSMTEYGVTVDVGKTWTFFDVWNTSQRDKIERFGDEVPRVSIASDGNGTIYMQSHHDKRGLRRTVYTTTDFGRIWEPSRAETLLSIP